MNIATEMTRLGLRLTKAALTAQTELSKTALEDCNKFCKVDSGAMRDSSYKASQLAKGRLIWDTPYARHAYYLGEANRSKNPLASRLWAHKAAAVHSREWEKTAKTNFITAMLQN